MKFFFSNKLLFQTNKEEYGKKFWSVCFSAFFVFISMQMLTPVVPFYLKSWGIEEGLIGIITGSFMISALLIRPIVGWRLDKGSKKKIFLYGLFLFSLAVLFCGLVSNIYLFSIVRILHGVAFGITSTAVVTIISDLLPYSKLGEGMGYFGMFNGLAMTIAPFTGLYLAFHFGYFWLFFISACLPVCSILLVWTLKIESPSYKRQNITFSKERESLLKQKIYEPQAFPASFSILFVSFAYSSIINFLQIYASEKGITSNIGSFFIVYAINMLIMRPIAGKLYDKYGPTFILIPSLILVGVSIFLLSYVRSLLGLIFISFIFGIGFGGVHPTLQALLIASVPPTRRGVANANFYSAMDIGMGGGAMLFGIIAQRLGYINMYRLASIAPLISMCIYLFWPRWEILKK
uniref:MFS transporter n=1 Tax=candidate division WOR-3 bacterium TaxID=2052148 RepID=A0A7C2K3T5_UNCW3